MLELSAETDFIQTKLHNPLQSWYGLVDTLLNNGIDPYIGL